MSLTSNTRTNITKNNAALTAAEVFTDMVNLVDTLNGKIVPATADLQMGYISEDNYLILPESVAHYFIDVPASGEDPIFPIGDVAGLERVQKFRYANVNPRLFSAKFSVAKIERARDLVFDTILSSARSIGNHIAEYHNYILSSINRTIEDKSKHLTTIDGNVVFTPGAYANVLEYVVAKRANDQLEENARESDNEIWDSVSPMAEIEYDDNDKVYIVSIHEENSPALYIAASEYYTLYASNKVDRNAVTNEVIVAYVENNYAANLTAGGDISSPFFRNFVKNGNGIHVRNGETHYDEFVEAYDSYQPDPALLNYIAIANMGAVGNGRSKALAAFLRAELVCTGYLYATTFLRKVTFNEVKVVKDSECITAANMEPYFNWVSGNSEHLNVYRAFVHDITDGVAAHLVATGHHYISTSTVMGVGTDEDWYRRFVAACGHDTGNLDFEQLCRLAIHPFGLRALADHSTEALNGVLYGKAKSIPALYRDNAPPSGTSAFFVAYKVLRQSFRHPAIAYSKRLFKDEIKALKTEVNRIKRAKYSYSVLNHYFGVPKFVPDYSVLDEVAWIAQAVMDSVLRSAAIGKAVAVRKHAESYILAKEVLTNYLDEYAETAVDQLDINDGMKVMAGDSRFIEFKADLDAARRKKEILEMEKEIKASKKALAESVESDSSG